MSRVYDRRNRGRLRFDAMQYAQMHRLMHRYGWTLRGVARQFGIAMERDNDLLQEIRRCGG